MSDSLLCYFEQELRFIREDASLFSARHPGAARSLGISQESTDDPQVTRLIESVALLNARLQMRLDDAFPELTGGLIGLLFPHYLRPIPSYTLLDFAITPQAKAAHHIPSGTEFDIQDEQGESAIFRTTEAIDLFPIHIAAVDVAFAPFEQAKPLGAENAKVLIELTIKTVDSGIDLGSLSLETLTLHLKGDNYFVLRLYDVLSLNTSQVCVFANGKSHALGNSAIKPSGFEADEYLLPYQGTSFGGFKLLTEFLMFPERFNRFTLDIKQAMQGITGNECKLQFFIDELSIDIAHSVNEKNFSLFSTPLINLHKLTCEPIQIDFIKKQYPLMLKATQGHHLTLFCIDEVRDVTEKEAVSVPQIYTEKFHGSKTGLRWQLVQSLSDHAVTSSLSVADLDHVSPDSASRIWVVKATVTDGIKPASLPINSQVSCRQLLTIPATMQLLRRPSLLARRSDASQNAWALLCHLHFNYHTILGADDPCAALKDLFELYNHNQSAQNRAYIDSILKIDQEQVVAPIRVSGKSCFAYGTKIVVTLDSDCFHGGISLFSHFLDRFFAYFAGFNSFTQLDISLEGQDGVYVSFPRRAGCKSYL